MLMALGGVGRRSPAPTNSSLTPCAFRASCPSVTPIPEVRHEIAFHKNWWFLTSLANARTFALRVGGRRSLAFRNWHRGGNRCDAYCSRQPHFHAIAQGKVLIAGGFAGSGSEYNPYRTAELFDPGSGTFQSAAEMTIGRSGHTATLLKNGKVLIVGGWTGRYDLRGSAE